MKTPPYQFHPHPCIDMGEIGQGDNVFNSRTQVFFFFLDFFSGKKSPKKDSTVPTFVSTPVYMREGGLGVKRVSQCVAVCCSALQCVTVCGSVLQCVVACCSVWQCVLQCVTVCYSVLQCVNVSKEKPLPSNLPGNLVDLEIQISSV